MCLNLRSKSFTEDCFKTAEKDIECYKLYIRRINTEWITPIRELPAPKLGETRKAKEAFNVLGIDVDEFMRTDNGIHTYSNIDSIIMMILQNGTALAYSHPSIRCDVRIVKSIIPKGTIYLEGFTLLGDSYASEYLVDVEVILQIDSTRNDAVDNLKKLLEFIRK